LDHPVGRVGAVVTNGQAGTTGKLVARLSVPSGHDRFQDVLRPSLDAFAAVTGYIDTITIIMPDVTIRPPYQT